MTPRFPHIATSPRAEFLVANFLSVGLMARLLGSLLMGRVGNDNFVQECA